MTDWCRMGCKPSIRKARKLIVEPRLEIFNNLTSVDLDEPPQPPFKLRSSKWCSVSSLTIIEYSRDNQRL